MTASVEISAPLWDYRVSVAGGAGLGGCAVHASDGPLGEVIVSHIEIGRSYLVLQGGPWIDGRMLMIPAGIVESVDAQARVVLVGCTRAEIASAPPFEGDRYRDGAYRVELGTHYESLQTSGAPGAAGDAGARWLV
jgi:hypothetical protein